MKKYIDNSIVWKTFAHNIVENLTEYMQHTTRSNTKNNMVPMKSFFSAFK